MSNVNNIITTNSGGRKRKARSQPTGQPNPKRRKIVRKARKSRKRNVKANNFALSLADPMNMSACIPDGSRGTGCFSVKETGILSTGTGSCVGMFVLPNIGNQYKLDTGSTSTGPTVSGNWTAASAYTTISNQYAKARPVSCGLKLNYIGNTTTDAGYMIIGQVSGGVPIANFNGITPANAAASFQKYEVFPIRAGGSITWRPDAEADVAVWTSTASAADPVATVEPIPYLAAFAFGVGPASSGILQYEFVANYEGQFKQQTYVPGGMSAFEPVATAEPGWYEKGLNFANRVRQVWPSVSETIHQANEFMNMANGYGYPEHLGHSGRITL
jgi:hypothetical protein